MKKFRGSLAVKWISAPSLLVCLCLGTLITGGVRAQGLSLNGEKVSHELRGTGRARRAAERVRVIVQLNDSAAGPLDSLLLLASGGRVTRRFQTLNTLTV
ncbi:MAG TPA: hypothetical protein VD861_01445, partial [Pyrinomonadaceae bacterium]|nr:hypothetical protein [Pyrinomonadaceae bacterium]